MCRTPEATRTTTMAARAWLPLSVLLLFQLAVAPVGAVVYNVGGNYAWGYFPTGFSFQMWSDSIDWYNGDVLRFRYDYSSHNVWAFEDQASFMTCDFSGFNLLYRDNSTAAVLPDRSPGSYSTVYFGSSMGADCSHGMAFSVTFYTVCQISQCSSSPSPPPPTRTSPSPPPPTTTIPSPPKSVTDSGSSEKKKTTVPVAAIAVPVVLVLVLVLGACTLVFCCVRKAKRQAQAAATPPKVPPQSPLPTDDPTPVPNGAPGPAREAATAGGSSIRALGL